MGLKSICMSWYQGSPNTWFSHAFSMAPIAVIAAAVAIDPTIICSVPISDAPSASFAMGHILSW